MKLGLNVGSGQRPFTSTPDVEWVNVDKVARTDKPLDLQCDGAHLPEFYNTNVDYFVLHHVLEHFGCGEAQGLIDEAWRVLKPGGSLLVFVPDMRMLADRWLRHEIDTQLYMTNVYGAYMSHEEDRHKWGYDRSSLALFMVGEHPWRSVDLFDWRPIPGADIARDWWIAGMECVR